MASAIVIGNSNGGEEATVTSPLSSPRFAFGASRLGRLIVGLNMLGLLVLIVGALVLNEFRRGLIEARLDSLTTQVELIADVMIKGATTGEPHPQMDADQARQILQLLAIPRSERIRLYDAQGQLIADTDIIADKVVERPLAPAQKRGAASIDWPWSVYFSEAAREARGHAQETAEVRAALLGRDVKELRDSETSSGRLVSVSIPIRPVKAVLGALTIEAGDVDKIVAAQRAALTPFILIAVATMLGSSLLLNTLVAEPVRRLARAADSVRLSRARAISLPDISERQDEVGDLSRSLESMTSTLSARMDAIERFAADVSHEIKNPLTSMRSALETLELAPAGSAMRDRLFAILQQDVRRLDRLITDIANASRMDAELSRESPRPIDLARFLSDISTLYLRLKAEDVAVTLTTTDGGPFLAPGREGPLGQVFRNLIDNARSFSPAGGEVRLSLARERRESGAVCVVSVEDDGPGIPSDNLESIFARFYTARPKGLAPGGAAFGGHSGLGLSIARQIVEAHGGRIRAENRLGPGGDVTGARFTIMLPAVDI